MASPYGTEDASFQAAGGEAGITQLVDAFYRAMDEEAHARVIREMHTPDLTLSRAKLTAFLCAWLGGPNRYREKFGPISIPGSHAHLAIAEPERDAWLRCMQTAVDAQPWAADFKHYFMRVIAMPAERIRMTCQARLTSAG